MRQIGLRELRDRASQILREVREDKNHYIITHHGRPVALLIPVDQEALKQHLQGEAERAATNKTLTQRLYGLVKARLSDAELDKLVVCQGSFS